MKKQILFLALFISSLSLNGQCVIDGTTLVGPGSKSTIYKACDVVVKSLTDGMVKSHGDSLKTAIAGLDYTTPSSVHDSLVNYVNKQTGSVNFNNTAADNLTITTDNGNGTGATVYMDNNQFLAGWDLASGGNFIVCGTGGTVLSTVDLGGTITAASGSDIILDVPSGHGVRMNSGGNDAIIKSDNVTGSDKTIQWPNASGPVVLNDNTAALTNKTYNGVTITGSSTPALIVVGSGITGNAGTATALQTPRTINGTSFDGTASIVVTAAAGTLTGSTINSGVTASSLTSFGASPSLITPILGTPTSGVLTNCTGTASGLTAGNVTTNANLTGPITSSGNATSIASQTGTGTKFVVDNTPTLITPNIGVATATSVNKVAITAPASSATLTLADGSTLQLSGAFVTNFIASAAVAATLPAGTYTLAKSTDVQTFTTSGTWTKPVGAKSVWVLCIGPGGGGGSGRKSTTGVLATGGAGGGSGGSSTMTFQASDITTSTVAVTVTAGGTGGASQTTNSTDGNAGQASSGYSNSTFGIYVQGGRGSGGGGGSSSGAVSGGLPGGGMFTGQTGGSSGGTGGAGGNGNNAIGWGSASGGAGGGITTGNVSAAGGNGGVFNQIPGSSAAAGGSADTGTAGTAGTAGTYIGTGAGAGGGSTVGNAGAGGNGANYGAGGGGGGAARDGVGNSGAGGNGAGGLVVVITYF